MFAVVTDSTAYLTKAEAEQLGVHIVEMNYTDSVRSYSESFSDCNGKFDKIIETGKWSTSQPSIGAFKSKFDSLLGRFDEIVCLVMSSRLSGTHSSAIAAARETDPEKVLIFDSLSTAGGLKIQVKRACALAREGVPAKEAVMILENERESVHMIFSVDDMEPLRRSGRLGVVRQAISAILNIRPILKLDKGSVVTSQLSKGRPDQIKKLTESVHPTASEIDVAYFGLPQNALKLMEGLAQKFRSVKITVSSVGPVLAIHLGLTAIGVAFRA